MWRVSLSSLMLIVTCIILLVIATYERHRANDIESKSILIASPEYRAVVEQDWQIIKRELQIQYAINGLGEPFNLEELDKGGNGMFPIPSRRELANIRNSRLKLQREKVKLEVMKSQIVQDIVNSVE